jgi:hypothetical protein
VKIHGICHGILLKHRAACVGIVEAEYMPDFVGIGSEGSAFDARRNHA